MKKKFISLLMGKDQLSKFVMCAPKYGEMGKDDRPLHICLLSSSFQYTGVADHTK